MGFVTAGGSCARPRFCAAFFELLSVNSKSETLPNRFQKCRLKAAETRAERSDARGTERCCVLPTRRQILAGVSERKAQPRVDSDQETGIFAPIGCLHGVIVLEKSRGVVMRYCRIFFSSSLFGLVAAGVALADECSGSMQFSGSGRGCVSYPGETIVVPLDSCGFKRVRTVSVEGWATEQPPNPVLAVLVGQNNRSFTMSVTTTGLHGNEVCSNTGVDWKAYGE